MPSQLTPNSIGGNSPNVHAIDDATLLVQGYTAPDPGIDLPAGEDAVTLPALLAIDASAALDAEGINLADLFRMLGVFAQSAFRLETCDGYAADRETDAFGRWFLTGGAPGPEDPETTEWVQLVRRHIAAGRSMRRVHVLPPEPRDVSDALAFELASQRRCNVPAGEHIRTVDAAAAPDLAGEADFWLFDDRVGVRMIYDGDGHLTCLERMTTAEVDRVRRVRDRAWQIGSDLDAAVVEVA